MSPAPDVNVPRDFEDLRGRVFNQRYAVSELLSAGRCHVVYGATDRKGAGQVLLRVMRPSLLRDRPTVERFEQRVQAARRASSLRARPSIDAGEARDGKLFLVCKRPPGRSLRQYVEEHEHGRLPWPMAEPLLRSLIEVVAAAHDRRIVHGGMMPDSFWLEEAEGTAPVAYVVDLGANPEVRIDGDAAPEGMRTTVLTADMEFTAPETAKSNAYDPRTDVYLLGLIAWFMLTGAPPFRGMNNYQVASMQMQQALPSLRGVVPGISEDVEGLIGRMLEKEPGARPQTMGELGRELAAVGMGVRAPVMVPGPAMSVVPVMVPTPVVSVVPTPVSILPAPGAVPGAAVMPAEAEKPPAPLMPPLPPRVPTMGEPEVPTIPRAPMQTPAARVEPTQNLAIRNAAFVDEVNAARARREREDAAQDVERTTAFVTRPVVPAREASVVQAARGETASEQTQVQWVQGVEGTQVQRVQEVPQASSVSTPFEGMQAPTAPLVQSGQTAVVRLSDLEPTPPVSAAPPVPVAAWMPEPVASASWSTAQQIHQTGPSAAVPTSASTMHGRLARETSGAVTLPIGWLVVAFVLTIAAGVVLGVWMAG